MSKATEQNLTPDLFQVGGGIGGYDFSVSRSYPYVLRIVFDVLSELKENEKNEILEGIYTVFEEWKNEHGIYPPNRGLFGLLSIGRSENPEPAKEYIKRQRLAAAASGEEPEYIKPWECDHYASTPVSLFLKLFVEDYKPLIKFMSENKCARYDYILATVTLMTHEPNQNRQSSDCILGAFQLAQSRLDFQKFMIDNMLPAAEKEFKRKQAARLKAQSKKDATVNAVQDVFVRLCTEKDGPPKNLQSAIAKEVGIKQPQVSKILKDLDLKTKKFDQFIHGLNKNIPSSKKNK